MILASEHIDERTKVPMKFYFGIDFDRVLSHPVDGSDGLMFCFFGNFEEECKKYKRESILNNILHDNDINSIEDINNNYIVLYQTGEFQKQVYESIRDKMIKHSWKYEYPAVIVGGEIKGYLIKDTRKTP